MNPLFAVGNVSCHLNFSFFFFYSSAFHTDKKNVVKYGMNMASSQLFFFQVIPKLQITMVVMWLLFCCKKEKKKKKNCFLIAICKWTL